MEVKTTAGRSWTKVGVPTGPGDRTEVGVGELCGGGGEAKGVQPVIARP